MMGVARSPLADVASELHRLFVGEPAGRVVVLRQEQKDIDPFVRTAADQVEGPHQSPLRGRPGLLPGRNTAFEQLENPVGDHLIDLVAHEKALPGACEGGEVPRLSRPFWGEAGGEAPAAGREGGVQAGRSPPRRGRQSLDAALRAGDAPGLKGPRETRELTLPGEKRRSGLLQSGQAFVHQFPDGLQVARVIEEELGEEPLGMAAKGGIEGNEGPEQAG